MSVFGEYRNSKAQFPQRFAAEVEAMRVEPGNERDVCAWINGEPDAWMRGYPGRAFPEVGGICIPALTGLGHEHVCWGDLAVRVAAKQFTACRAEVFDQTYEATKQAGGRAAGDELRQRWGELAQSLAIAFLYGPGRHPELRPDAKGSTIVGSSHE